MRQNDERAITPKCLLQAVVELRGLRLDEAQMFTLDALSAREESQMVVFRSLAVTGRAHRILEEAQRLAQEDRVEDLTLIYVVLGFLTIEGPERTLLVSFGHEFTKLREVARPC